MRLHLHPVIASVSPRAAVNVPVMDNHNEDEARRFIALVDEFYERHVKLVTLAEAELFDIYQR